MSDSSRDGKRSDLRVFLTRGLRLRCPECGVSPIFGPLRLVRTLSDWSKPLDGCPRCGYAYEREQGYFLISTWVINYGIVAGLGTAVGFAADHWWHPPLWKLLLCVGVPMVALSFLLIRHSKSVFIAIDHFLDPHVKN